ncbi:hypothetical protein IGI04_032043 [Brassica rapa subsp. trilocularis]|uniref:Peptidase A1 domain-containing protein n=1 Tax=Brassica rapa subsp. trilocularis TaxID=1813537 RepID=A0ABQ7LVB9_BRACM|nr:hypothetical protein IGI04_032043 [Brassica rapa subsp. trilocularis]
MCSHRCFLLLIFFLASHSSVTSRILPKISVTTTTTLDVTDSIRKTKDASSFQLNQQEEQSQYPTSSSFSLQLHSRASVRGTEHPDYKSLTLARLHRDSARVSYGDGSFTAGDFATETFTIGSASVDNVAVGCGHSNQGLFVGAAGLLGLGGGLLALPSQLNTTSFSYCLVDRDSDSSSTVEFGSDIPNDAVVAPLLRNHQLDTFYYLGLAGISVGGEMLEIPASSFEMDESGGGGVIIDSGTAVTRLQTGVYDSLRDAFVKGTADLERAAGVAMFDTCYDLSGKTTIEVPSVAFHFPGGNMLALPAKNYMIPVDSVGTFCLAFAPTASSLAIIGNVQQQGTRVGFDLANSLIGFSANKC